jgi:hypothetical protein
MEDQEGLYNSSERSLIAEKIVFGVQKLSVLLFGISRYRPAMDLPM